MQVQPLLVWQNLQVLLNEPMLVKGKVFGTDSCYGSCGASVIILAPLNPFHFSLLITNSACLSVLSQASVLCFQINIKFVEGESSSLSVLMKEGIFNTKPIYCYRNIEPHFQISNKQRGFTLVVL